MYMNNYLKEFLYRVKNLFLNSLTKFSKKSIRKLYWNLRAYDINKNWGSNTEDFNTLKQIIKSIRPIRILDIGCGSGRCFPLYNELSIHQVFGQDISSIALSLCKKRFPFLSYQLQNCQINELIFEDNYFDLIISNRVLSAVLPKDIGKTLTHLCKIGCHLYINELSDSDFADNSTYWFKHDYFSIMSFNGFSLIEKGKINKQTWYLFKKKSSL